MGNSGGSYGAVRRFVLHRVVSRKSCSVSSSPSRIFTLGPDSIEHRQWPKSEGFTPCKMLLHTTRHNSNFQMRLSILRLSSSHSVASSADGFSIVRSLDFVASSVLSCWYITPQPTEQGLFLPCNSLLHTTFHNHSFSWSVLFFSHTSFVQTQHPKQNHHAFLHRVPHLGFLRHARCASNSPQHPQLRHRFPIRC